MRALVTGGKGFIGGALVNFLLGRGWDVVVVDNALNPKFCRLPTPDNRRLKLHTFDCRELNLREHRIGQVDGVFHFATHFANKRSLVEPMENVSVNMLGTMAVLEFCRRTSVKKLVYASSSGVYASRGSAVCAEDQSPAPITPYEVTKYSGELLCKGYCELYGISLLAPRFFNVYGPGDVSGSYRGVIPNFWQAALRGQDLIVTGVRVSRDFTYVNDVVRAVMAGYHRLEKVPDRISLTYNIGTGREVAISRLAQLIIEKTQSKSRVLVSDARDWDNCPRRVADCQRFRGLFPEEAAAMRNINAGMESSRNWYNAVCK